MTTGVICSPPILQFTLNNGQLAINGSILTQVGGVNAVTYADSGLTTPLPNPIPLNSRGEISDANGNSRQLFLTPNTVYTFTLYDGPNGTGNQIWQASYVNGIQISGEVTAPLLAAVTDTPILASLVRTAAEIAAGVTPTNYAYAPGPLLDARRYGVVADGVTDNATSLTNFAAVLKQTPGTIGILPSGTINCSSLTALVFNSTIGITLQGGSALNGTKLIYTGTGTGNFIDARSSFGFTMQFLTVGHSNSGFTGNLISFQHDGSAIDAQHGLLSRCTFGSTPNAYTATGINLDKADLITIDNCEFAALNIPISGQSGAGGSYSVGHRITNCQFAGYGFYAIYYGGQGWKIRGNNFQPNQSGLVEVVFTNVNTPVDGFSFQQNTVLDATGASTVLILYQALGLEITNNVVGCGGGGGVFLQANGQVIGFSMKANHISQANVGIQVANVAHSGWSINGNYFDTVTTKIDHPEYVTGINLEGNSPNIMGRWFQVAGPASYSASITLDASTGNYFEIVVTNGSAFTINAPTNPVDRQRITIQIVNGNGAALGAVTWAAGAGGFKMSAWTQPTANNNNTIDFVYNASAGFWYQAGAATSNVPN